MICYFLHPEILLLLILLQACIESRRNSRKYRDALAANCSDLSSGWTCLNCVPEGHVKYVVDMQTYFTYMRVP